MKKPTNVPIVTNNIGTIAAFIPIPTKKPIESEANIIEININATENNEIINFLKINPEFTIEGERKKIELENLDFTINSDIKWLNFIVEQILLNSLKYTDNNGTISADEQPVMTSVTVID